MWIATVSVSEAPLSSVGQLKGEALARTVAGRHEGRWHRVGIAEGDEEAGKLTPHSTRDAAIAVRAARRVHLDQHLLVDGLINSGIGHGSHVRRTDQRDTSIAASRQENGECDRGSRVVAENRHIGVRTLSPWPLDVRTTWTDAVRLCRCWSHQGR